MPKRRVEKVQGKEALLLGILNKTLMVTEQQCLVQGGLGPGSGGSQDEGMAFCPACSPLAPEEGLQHSAHHHEWG